MIQSATNWRFLSAQGRTTDSDKTTSIWRQGMPAYWVARSKIIDPVEYKKYTDLVPGIMEKYKGRVLARGGKFQIMEGPEQFHRFVVIEFATMEDAVCCFNSEEYRHAAEFRRKGAGNVENVIVEGGDATPR
jgi:uncharacterized protein (DUF1330 family)